MNVQALKLDDFTNTSNFLSNMNTAEASILSKAFIISENEKQDSIEECTQMAADFRQNNLLMNNRYRPRRLKRKAGHTK